MERNIYLENTDIDEALSIYLARLECSMGSVAVEKIKTGDGLGRVLAKPVFARVSAPNYNAAAMDGIMVVASATYEASEASPVSLLRGRDFEYINTGHPMLEPYDAVIMIEDIVLPGGEDSGTAVIKSAASPWQHVRPVGEDIVAGEMVLPANHQIRPMDIGAVLLAGIGEVEVYERVRIGIMPTGTEITDSYEHLEKGMIFDGNSWTFKAVAEELGCVAERISPVPDDYEALRKALQELLERNHLVVINGGSSAGSKDYTKALISELGELVLHGIAIKPGKPTILGIIGSKPVIGVPGYPGSAFLVFEEIVGAVIRKLQHAREASHRYAQAVLTRRVVSSLKYREYIRVKLGAVDGRLIATPLNRGAGVTMALVEADGLLVIPKNSEGFEAGEMAQVELTRDIRDIENTLVSIGSQDMIMDFVANLMEKEPGNIHLSSAHVGSMGGILALKRGEAHMAPIHLLDEETGEYNQSYIDRYLGEDFVLIKGVPREQGLIIPKGNPKGIRAFDDIAERGLTFVNRQRGSGTRLLADYLFKKSGADTDRIVGYDREMTTHMAVAAAVEAGTADAGLGAYSAAKVMGLDFIFIANEEYDFAIGRKYLETPMVKAFLKVLGSEEFHQILRDLGGYGE